MGKLKRPWLKENVGEKNDEINKYIAACGGKVYIWKQEFSNNITAVYKH